MSFSNFRDGTSSSSPLYALYHLLHVLEARCGQVVGESVLDELTLKCLSQLEVRRKESPLELFWVLFALSCIPKQHHLVAERADAVTQVRATICHENGKRGCFEAANCGSILWVIACTLK